MMMGDPDLAPARRLRQGADVAAEGAQRQVGRPDGDQRRAGHLGQHHRPGAREAAQRGQGRARRQDRRRQGAGAEPRSPPRRSTSARSSRCCRAISRTRKAVLDEKAIDPARRRRRSRARPPTQFWQDFDKDPFEALEFLENRIAPPGRRRRPAVPPLRRHRPRGVPEVVRPHEDRRRHDGPAGQARLPVRQVRLRGSAEAQDGAPARQDQGGRSTRRRRRSPPIPTCSAWCARTPRRCARSCCSSTRRRRPTSAPSCSASSAARRPTSASCWPRFFQTDDENFHERYDFFYNELAPSLELYRVRIGDMLTIKAFTAVGLRAVGERPGLRHLPVPGAGEVDAGGRAQPDGHGLVPRALRLHERREAGRDPGAAEGSRAPSEVEPRERRGRAVRQGRRARGGARGQGAAAASRRPRRRASPRCSTTSANRCGGKLQREEARSRVFPAGEVEQGRGAQRRRDRQGPHEDQGDHRGDRGPGEAGRADAQGDRLAEGRRASSASSSTSSGWCSTSRS